MCRFRAPIKFIFGRKNSNELTVGALCERALLVESTNYARSQTAPTVKSVPLSSFSAAC